MFQSGSSLLAKNGIGPVLVLISLSRRYGRRCHEEGQGVDFVLWTQGRLGAWGTRTRRENERVRGHRKRGRAKHLIGA